MSTKRPKRRITRDQHQTTLDWLVSEQAKGSFEGMKEHSLDFHSLDGEDFVHYFFNWYLKDLTRT